MTRPIVRRFVINLGCVLMLCSLTGCEDRGIELELHLAKKSSDQFRLEILIDEDGGQPPRKVAPGVFAIDFSEVGVARIDSPYVLRQWHKLFIVTSHQRRARNEGYTEVDSGWVMATVTEKLRGGGVKSTSVVNGSKYWMEIKLLDAENDGNGASQSKGVRSH